MPQTAVAFGVLLCLVGVGFYAGTGGASVTALIPAFIGLPLVLAGGLARREGLRRHAMHAAALLGTLGLLGSLRGAVNLPTLLRRGRGRPPGGGRRTVGHRASLPLVRRALRALLRERPARAEDLRAFR